MSVIERVVFDTNVVVSALLMPGSVPRRAFNKALTHATVLISLATAAELNDVLRRSRFDRYLPEDERLQLLDGFLRQAIHVVRTELITDCRDPKDNKFLELAVSGRATYIISGDDDLLMLHPFRGISILTPRQFLDKDDTSSSPT